MNKISACRLFFVIVVLTGIGFTGFSQIRPAQVVAKAKIVAARFPSPDIELREYPRPSHQPAGNSELNYEFDDADDGPVFTGTQLKFRKKIDFEKKIDLEDLQKKLPPDLHAKLIPKSQWDVPVGGVDPMIAAGHQYITVCDGGSLAFYNKTGLKLTGSNLPSSARQLFAPFLDLKLKDGNPNPNHPNNWFPDVPVNVPEICNPDHIGETDDGIIQHAYDTRILYEKTYKRFVILSAIRNHCWSCKDCNQAEKIICQNSSVRLYAWAVSVTEDPRDGFYLYITGNNNVRDWPRVVVDQDYMVVAHNGQGRLGTPAISIYSWPDMVAGSSSIRRIDFKADENSPRMYVPIQNRLPAAGHLLFVHKNGDAGLEFYQIKKPGIRNDIFKSSLLVRPQYIGGIDADDKIFKGPLSGITYDNKGVHFTSTQVEESGLPKKAPRYSAHIWTIPLVNAGGGKLALGAFTGAAGYQHYRINSQYSYELPAIAVNSLNDKFIGFVRSSVTANGDGPEIRYTAWIHGKPEPINSVLVRKSESQPVYKCNQCTVNIPDNLTNKDDDKTHLDYAWAVADPQETGVFWLAHAYYNASKELRTHVAKINVVPLY